MGRDLRVGVISPYRCHVLDDSRPEQSSSFSDVVALSATAPDPLVLMQSRAEVVIGFTDITGLATTAFYRANGPRTGPADSQNIKRQKPDLRPFLEPVQVCLQALIVKFSSDDTPKFNIIGAHFDVTIQSTDAGVDVYNEQGRAKDGVLRNTALNRYLRRLPVPDVDNLRATDQEVLDPHQEFTPNACSV
ncbi:hypothetical protein SprV_0301271900 [Sparganum proliferum]